MPSSSSKVAVSWKTVLKAKLLRLKISFSQYAFHELCEDPWQAWIAEVLGIKVNLPLHLISRELLEVSHTCICVVSPSI